MSTHQNVSPVAHIQLYPWLPTYTWTYTRTPTSTTSHPHRHTSAPALTSSHPDGHIFTPSPTDYIGSQPPHTRMHNLTHMNGLPPLTHKHIQQICTQIYSELNHMHFCTHIHAVGHKGRLTCGSAQNHSHTALGPGSCAYMHILLHPEGTS